jgi:hypothetical protein
MLAALPTQSNVRRQTFSRYKYRRDLYTWYAGRCQRPADLSWTSKSASRTDVIKDSRDAQRTRPSQLMCRTTSAEALSRCSGGLIQSIRPDVMLINAIKNELVRVKRQQLHLTDH